MDGIFYDCMDGNDTKMPRIVRRGSLDVFTTETIYLL